MLQKHEKYKEESSFDNNINCTRLNMQYAHIFSYKTTLEGKSEESEQVVDNNTSGKITLRDA